MMYDRSMNFHLFLKYYNINYKITLKLLIC